jgi:hypothetical protein
MSALDLTFVIPTYRLRDFVDMFLADETQVDPDAVNEGSIELWPTLVEISCFQKGRRGLPQRRVANQEAGERR